MYVATPVLCSIAKQLLSWSKQSYMITWHLLSPDTGQLVYCSYFYMCNYLTFCSCNYCHVEIKMLLLYAVRITICLPCCQGLTVFSFSCVIMICSTRPPPKARKPPPAPRPSLPLCKALYDYEATDLDELSFKEGSVIEIIKEGMVVDWDFHKSVVTKLVSGQEFFQISMWEDVNNSNLALYI